MKVAVLVLGTHESGASGVARAIATRGLAFPRTGDWSSMESELLRRENERLLIEVGYGSWRLEGAINKGKMGAVGAERLKQVIQEEFGGAGRILIKDPRINHLVGVYRRALGDMGYSVRVVLVSRNPMRVVPRLRRRGMSKAVAVRLWERGVLDAEELSRGVPRTWLQYEDFVEDPKKALLRALMEVNVGGPYGGNYGGPKKEESGELEEIEELMELWEAVKDGELGFRRRRGLEGKPRVIQMSLLGGMGNTGNQVFQYLFLKGYSERFGLRLEIPKEWVGRRLYEGIDDPGIDDPLPSVKRDVPLDGEFGVAYVGWCQRPWHLKYWTRTQAKKWLRVREELVEEFRGGGRDVCAHVRRGDYVPLKEKFALVDIRSYHRALEEMGVQKEEVYWAGEEFNADPRPEFEPYFATFVKLMKARVLLRGNSTFSWAAGLLGDAEVWAPVVRGRGTGLVDVPFVRGNYPGILTVQDDFIVEE